MGNKWAKPKIVNYPMVIPKGPPTNLRPGGAHKQIEDVARQEKERKALLEQEDTSGE